MSLINRMLQDLDARAGLAGERETPVYEDLLPAGEAAGGAGGRARGLLVAGGVLVLLLGLGGILLNSSRQGANSGPAAAAAGSPTLETASRVEDHPPPPLVEDAPSPPPFDAAVEEGEPQPAGPARKKREAQPAASVTGAGRQAQARSVRKTESKGTVQDDSRHPPRRVDEHMSRKSPSASSRARNLYRQGVAYLREGRLAEGEALLYGALRLEPRHHAARLALAEFLVGQKRPEQAVELLRQGLAISPQHLPLARLLARTLVETGAAGQALAVLEGVREKGMGDPEYLSFLAHLYQLNSRHGLAIRYYSLALDFSPAHGNWWLGLGLSHEALGNSAAALMAYEEAQKRISGPRAVLQFVAQRISALRGQMSPRRGDAGQRRKSFSSGGKG